MRVMVDVTTCDRCGKRVERGPDAIGLPNQWLAIGHRENVNDAEVMLCGFKCATEYLENARSGDFIGE